VRYLPQIQALDLTPEQIAQIRVRPEPPSDEEFISLGELPLGAPPVGERSFPFTGTRQLYVARSDAPDELWERLATGLLPHRPSGSGGTPLFGNPDERVVDEENPALSWRRLNAGERPP
jgi:hypothetical protein